MELVANLAVQSHDHAGKREDMVFDTPVYTNGFIDELTFGQFGDSYVPSTLSERGSRFQT